MPCLCDGKVPHLHFCQGESFSVLGEVLERFWGKEEEKNQDRPGPTCDESQRGDSVEALECARPPLHFSFQPNSTPVAQVQPSEQPPDCPAPHALPPAASLHFVLSTLGCGDAGLVLAGISGHLPRPAVNSLEQDCASGFSFTLPAFCSLHLVNCLPQSCGVSATWQGRCKDVSVGQFPLRPQPQQLHLELYCGLGFHVKCHLKQRGVLLKSVKTSSLHSWISEALVGGTYCSHLLAVCAILQHGSNPSLHD